MRAEPHNSARDKETKFFSADEKHVTGINCRRPTWLLSDPHYWCSSRVLYSLSLTNATNEERYDTQRLERNDYLKWTATLLGEYLYITPRCSPASTISPSMTLFISTPILWPLSFINVLRLDANITRISEQYYSYYSCNKLQRNLDQWAKKITTHNTSSSL